ncbi:ankyrin repeat domain-containing protein [Sulfurimonas sp.]
MTKIVLILCLIVSLHAGIMEDIGQFNKVLQDAQSGNKISQYWVAERYFNGKGTQVDKKEGIYWLQKSAKQGYIKSMLLLGEMFTQVKSNKEIELLGVKYLDELVHYDKTFPQEYKTSKHYSLKYREIAFDKLIKLYTKGGYYLKADKQKAKQYLNEYKTFKLKYKFFSALERAGLFYADDEDDKKIQNTFIECVKEGVDANATYEESKGLHYSLLFYSIIKKNEELFNLLLSKGADINYKGKDGKNAFYIAIFNRNLKFAKVLYAKGIELDFTTTKHNPLVVAALDEDKEMIEYLVSIGYKPKENVLLQSDLLAFMLDDPYLLAKVFNYSKHDISTLFIEWVIKKYGFDVNGTASRKDIPYLCIALISGSKYVDEKVELLLKLGAHPNAKVKGYYPLNFVSMKAPMDKKVALLLKYGADKNLKNKFGNNAVEFYEKEIAQNNKKIKQYSNSKENKVRITQTNNRNIQGIVDNTFGEKLYLYKDKVYKKYNENLREAIKVLKL